MTLCEAADKVLRATRRPMHSREIVEYARARGWLDTSGKTPDHSLQAAIWNDIKENGRESVFQMVGRGKIHRMYSLRSARRRGLTFL
jgi:hypothetical protein